MLRNLSPIRPGSARAMFLNTVIGPYSRFGKYLLVLAFIDLLLGSAFWGARRCLNVVEPSVNYAAGFIETMDWTE